MRDILYPDDPAQPKDAYVSVRKSMERPLPRRFYTAAAVESADGRHQIVLDGRKALTPARNGLALPTRAAADLVAAEWNGVATVIDPGLMHATRIANVGIDRVEAVREAVIDEIVKYARSDLVCFRAADPARLVAEENRHWNGVLDHIRQRYGAQFILSQGLTMATQPESAVEKIRAAVAAVTDPVALAALSTMTALTGSVLIALAVADGGLEAEAGFDAAFIEEDWNARSWGDDVEATARRARRHAEFMTAAALFRALGPA